MQPLVAPFQPDLMISLFYHSELVTLLVSADISMANTDAAKKKTNITEMMSKEENVEVKWSS